MQERYEHRGLRAMNRGNEKWREKTARKKSIQTCAHLPASKKRAGYLAGSGRFK